VKWVVEKDISPRVFSKIFVKIMKIFVEKRSLAVGS
jgi:hypothetical protein